MQPETQSFPKANSLYPTAATNFLLAHVLSLWEAISEHLFQVAPVPAPQSDHPIAPKVEPAISIEDELNHSL